MFGGAAIYLSVYLAILLAIWQCCWPSDGAAGYLVMLLAFWQCCWLSDGADSWLEILPVFWQCCRLSGSAAGYLAGILASFLCLSMLGFIRLFGGGRGWHLWLRSVGGGEGSLVCLTFVAARDPDPHLCCVQGWQEEEEDPCHRCEYIHTYIHTYFWGTTGTGLDFWKCVPVLVWT